MSKNSYDSIFVIIDRLTEYGIFLPYRENSNVEQLAYTFLREVIANHGLPVMIFIISMLERRIELSAGPGGTLPLAPGLMVAILATITI